jgi:hypothetical protein
MKFPLYLLAALALCACAGPEGNLNRQPYADQPGGMIAVRPEPAPATSYDPNVAQPAFDDMRISQPALNPPPAPMPVYKPPAR